MGISKAQGQWEGSLKTGHGSMKPENAEAIPFSLGTRFEGKKGSNPEEVIGAALAGCFSMALTVALEHGGLTPKSIHTSSKVHLEKDGEGFSIKTIELSTEGVVEGIDEAKFQAIAAETKKNCPVAKLVTGATVTLEAKLAK